MQITKTYEILESTWQDPMPERPPQYSPYLKLIQWGFMLFGRLFPTLTSKIAYRVFSTPRYRAGHRYSDEIIEAARIFEFMYAGQILKAYEWGKGRKTVLLVHGWESRGTGLRSFVPRLVQAGFRVVAFDGPAHGHSTGKQTNLAEFAGATAAILNNIGEVYGIIAHSFGGVATTNALRHLNKNIAIEKLVYVGVPSHTVAVLRAFTEEICLPPKATQKFMQILKGTLGKIPSKETNIVDAENQINAKDVLVVHDKKDHIVPFRAAENIFNQWETASLLATEGYGHFRLIKNPDVLDQIAWFMHD